MSKIRFSFLVHLQLASFMPNHRIKLFFALLLLMSTSGCRTASPVSSGATVPATLVKLELPIKNSRLPESRQDSVYEGLYCKSCVFDFYQSRNFEPLWNSGGQWRATADSLQKVIEDVYYFGLLGDYHLQALDNSCEPARREVFLTDAFLKLVSDLRRGVSDRNSVDSIAQGFLVRLADGQKLTALLSEAEPTRAAYRRLKQELSKGLDSLDAEEKSALRSGRAAQRLNPLFTIMVNMERWRRESMPATEYVLVNVPAFRLDVFIADSAVFTSDVIVGKPETPTPLLSSIIECIVVYPYWNVPRKITVEEYLPLIQKDTTFISRNQFDVLDRKGNAVQLSASDWSQLSKNHFPYSLRQREGSENSLGLLKFVFDNPYAVYLHDTNSRRLFSLTNRALSHGCVRVAAAEKFAHFLLTRKADAESPALEKYLQQKERRLIAVDPLPIYIRYFTSEWRNDRLFFYHDIYRQDRTILAQLRR